MEQIFGANAWKCGGKPRVGRDGKWTLNRCKRGGIPVDIIEFTTLREPCCSPCTGAPCGPNK